MIDYAENLCEAMKIIFEKQIKQLSFDITIDATVVDATNAKNGMYVVSHDGATFTAYSTDTSFKEKDVVMVTIPQGNYDNQKMIIGKQVNKNKEEKPITYQSPFSQIVNLSGNLVYGNIEEKGLLANDGNQYRTERYQQLLEKENNLTNSEREEKEQIEQDIKNAQIILIKELKSSDSTLSEEYQSNGYTKLGLRADFSTWLNEFNIVSGNYGLILTLTFNNPDSNKDIPVIYTFDSSEFFGDIYNFETYYNQEAVFDISDYSDYFLQEIKLEAYQLDNFETSNETLLSYENMLSKSTDNIFIKEPFICLGTAIEEFKKDNIKIVTDSSSTYTSAENVKNLKLKWIHQDLNSKDIYVVQEGEIPANYEIRWYKFKLGEESPDEFMDAHWARFYGQNKTQDDDDATNKINISFSPDTTNQTEQIRAIVLKTENNNTTLVARSSIITFNNDKEVPNKANKIDANALGIQFTDFEKGKYYYYNKVGKIIYSESDKNRKHYLKAVFENDVDLNNKQNLEEQSYTSIKWTLPSTNSMIIPVLPDGKTINQIEFTTDPSDPDVFIFNNFSENDLIENNYYYKGYEIRKNNHNNTYEIFLDQPLPQNALESALVKLEYKIDENYSFNKTRNNVFLEVEINNQKYITSTMMFFGLSGTSGSDYTIVIDWGISGQEPPVFNVEKNNELRGSVRLLDIHGETVNLNEKAIYKYKWYQLKKDKDLDGLTIIDNNSENIDIQDISWSPDNIHNSSFILKDVLKNNNSQITINDLYILEVKLTNFGDYNLIARYPIALKNSFKKNNQETIVINSMTGTTTLRYASDGTITPDDNNFYSIQFQYWDSVNGKFQEADSKVNGYWRIITENNVNNNFFPELIEVNNEETTIDAFLLELKKLKVNDKFTNQEILNIVPIFISPQDLESVNIDDIDEETLNSNFEDFLSKLDYIFHTNVKTLLLDKSLLNILQKITPNVNQNNIELKQSPIDILIQNLKNDWQSLSEGISSMEDNNTFKQYLLTINKKKLKQLFLILEEKNIGFSSKNFQKTNPILSPPNFYIKDTSLYGVQYVLNDTLENQFYLNKVLYTQPIYIYQDNYPSATINKWNGKDLILDEENGTITTNGFSAGRKEDNQFFGVMIGDWSRTEEEDDSITKTTGIYGFHEGTMSYAFKDDGTAFIGKDGKGRIEFDGNKGVIQSSGFNLLNQTGSQFNLQDGSLFLFGNKEITVDQQEKYSLILNSNGNSKDIDTIFSVGRNYILNNQLLGGEELNIYKDVIDDTENIYKNIFSFLQSDNIIYQLYQYYRNSTNQDVPLTNDFFPKYSFMDFITNEFKEYYVNDKQGLVNASRTSINKIFPKVIFDFYNFRQSTSPFSEGDSEKNYYYKGDELESYDFTKGVVLSSNSVNIDYNSYNLQFSNNSSYSNNYFYKIQLLPDGLLKYIINEYIYYLSEVYSNSGREEQINILSKINEYYGNDSLSFTSTDFKYFTSTARVGLLSPYSLKINYTEGDFTIKSFYRREKDSKFYDIDSFVPLPNKVITSIQIYAYSTHIESNIKQMFSASTMQRCESYGFELYIYTQKNQTYYQLDLIKEELQYTKLPILKDILYKEWRLATLESKINDFIETFLPRISYRSNLNIQYNENFISINKDFYTYKTSLNSEDIYLTLIKNTSQLAASEINGINSEEELARLIQINYQYILPSNYKNNLIYIDKNGGYLTSKNYRPTIDLSDANAILRDPFQSQKWNSEEINTYGLKGLIIDLTNDRIVLGNNSSIIGYQSDSGGRDTQNDFPSLREFSISTGANYSKTLDNNNLEKIFDNKNFIIAEKYNANRASTTIFKIDWDGNTIINGDITINGDTNITVKDINNNGITQSNKQIKYKYIDGTYFLCVN